MCNVKYVVLSPVVCDYFYFQLKAHGLCFPVWGNLIYGIDANWERRYLKIDLARIWGAAAWSGTSGTLLL